MPQDLPVFPALREPLISDCRRFHELADKNHPVTSELTFTNIYVWRNAYDFLITSLNGNICVLAQEGRSSPFFLPPVGENNLEDTVRTLAAYVGDRGYQQYFSRLPEDTAHRISQFFPGSVVEEDRDNADYVYLTSDLANLPGRKYHKKKNHIARFTERYSYRYSKLTPDLIPAVREMQTDWCGIRGCFTPEHTSLAVEHVAIIETLDNFDALRAVGGVIIVDDKLAGFSIGEPLNEDTFVIHFEKANQDYQGAYQTLNQQFCRNECLSYTYVNREQDLGEQGLRQAKSSYHPNHLVMKYRVRIPG